MPDTRSAADIRAARPSDVAAIAAIHEASFPEPWPDAYWLEQIADSQTLLYAATEDGGACAGYVLARRVADEAEILSLAVEPLRRRSGLAQSLLQQLIIALARDPPCRLFLEVSVENQAATALYRRNGFIEVGVRENYYRRQAGPPADASILALGIEG